MIKNFHKAAIMTAEHDVSYSEMFGRTALFATHTPSERGAHTIIFSENREGWIYALLSIWRNEGVAVPVDCSSTVQDLAYILRDCTPTAVWTSRQCEPTVRSAVSETGSNAAILLIEDYERVAAEPLDEWPGINQFEDTPEACGLIIYTSGTTGSPKGVMLSFRNMWANMTSVSQDVPIFNTERRTMILLPLHHVLPLMGSAVMPLVIGAGVAICPSMTGPDIMQTLQRSQSAIIIGVPRLWQTLFRGIKKKLDEKFITRMLFSLCEKAHSRKLSRTIFKKIHDMMGGHLEYCVCGGAALDTEIGRGLTTLGLEVLEGYGMTECAPIIAFTHPGDYIPGCAGRVLPNAEVKLIDGELCARGPQVMIGYYNRPEETAAVLDSDGFLHTGDLARVEPDGHVYITGRTKEIIVLSNGKNVQPAEIEYKLETYDAFVKEAAVIQQGDMLQAIIVPQEQWAARMSDTEVEAQLKQQVLRPYNLTVENYKKLMSLCVYRGQLPRTKLDKLQRFKLPALAQGKGDATTATSAAKQQSTLSKEARILINYISEEKKMDVTPDMHLETDLAFDSLDMVGLQSFIEQTFGVTIAADKLATFRNVQELADRLSGSDTKKEVEHIDWHHTLTSETTTLELPRGGIVHRCYARMFRYFFRIYNRLSIQGVENIPQNGPFILAANHQSYMDGAIVMAGIPWGTLDKCYFYATEEHVQGSVLKHLAHEHNVILMERQNLKNSILKMAEVLKRGRNIVIFPEGSRTYTGDMITFKKTFAILSAELQVPVLPVCIRGAFDAMPRGTHYLKPKKITVEYLPTIMPQQGEDYKALSARVQDTIGEALKK